MPTKPTTKKKKAPKRVLVAKVDHYFGKIKVAAFTLKAPLKTGDTVTFEGGDTFFSQKVASLQKEHEKIARARKGDSVGMKVREKVRDGYRVYKEA